MPCWPISPGASWRLTSVFCAMCLMWRQYLKKLGALFICITDKKSFKLLRELNFLTQIKKNPRQHFSYILFEISYILYFYLRMMNEMDYERYVFRLIQQEDGELFNSFITRLRNQITKCDFLDPETQFKDQILEKCTINGLRKKAFENRMSLDHIIFTGRILELAEINCRSGEDFSSKNNDRKMSLSPTRDSKSSLALNNIQRKMEKSQEDLKPGSSHSNSSDQRVRSPEYRRGSFDYRQHQSSDYRERSCDNRHRSSRKTLENRHRSTDRKIAAHRSRRSPSPERSSASKRHHRRSLSSRSKKLSLCRRCGFPDHHVYKNCTSFGYQCKNCFKIGHSEVMCYSLPGSFKTEKRSNSHESLGIRKRLGSVSSHRNEKRSRIDKEMRHMEISPSKRDLRLKLMSRSNSIESYNVERRKKTRLGSDYTEKSMSLESSPEKVQKSLNSHESRQRRSTSADTVLNDEFQESQNQYHHQAASSSSR